MDKLMEARETEKILKEWVKRPCPELHSLIEISFKAGIREVVEWLEQYHTHAPFHNFSIYLTEEEWQAKLKEWGIECQTPSNKSRI